jgi:hypothetical protein
VENSRLSVDLEDVYVSTATAGSAVVIRGQYGSTAAVHASGATVHVNPSWSNHDIAVAVNEELADLSSPANGLFRIRTAEVTYNPSKMGYELVASDLLDVWRVRYNSPGPEDDWQIVDRNMWRSDQAADPTDFPSGAQVVLKAGGWPGQAVRISYRAAYDPLTALADDVEAVSGLQASAHDILSLGSAIRLLSGLGAQRALTTSQPDPRRSAETQSRDAAIALAPMQELHENRVRAEAARLARKYPQATR